MTDNTNVNHSDQTRFREVYGSRTKYPIFTTNRNIVQPCNQKVIDNPNYSY